MVALIHVENTHRADADRQLQLALERRNKAAERCVIANEQAQAAKADLIQHLAAHLAAGIEQAVLRAVLINAGIHQTVASAMLTTAGGLTRSVQAASDPRHPELPYGSP